MGSINQSKSFTMGVYRGRSLREFTVRQVTAGVYCGRFNDLIGYGGDT